LTTLGAGAEKRWIALRRRNKSPRDETGMWRLIVLAGRDNKTATFILHSAG
jgi:hypothetical protein